MIQNSNPTKPKDNFLPASTDNSSCPVGLVDNAVFQSTEDTLYERATGSGNPRLYKRVTRMSGLEEKAAPLNQFGYHTCSKRPRNDQFTYVVTDSRRSGQSNHNKLRRRSRSLRKRTPPVQLNEVLWDDLFWHTMTFVVPPSGLVDGETFRSMQLVCKRWYSLSNSPVVWSCFSSTEPGERRSRPSQCVRDVTERRSHFAMHMAGFAKLGNLETLWHKNDDKCYRVRERSTGKIYIARLFTVDKRDRKPTIPSLRVAHCMLGDEEFLQEQNKYQELLYLPKGVQLLAGGYNILFYDDCQCTLAYWLRANRTEPPIHLTQLKNWWRQLLKIVWLITAQRSWGCAFVDVLPTAVVLANGRLRFAPFAVWLSPEQRGYHPEFHLEEANRVWSVGLIVRQLCRARDGEELAFDALGEDLLRKMTHFDPHQRITARDALQHQFFEGFEAVPSLLGAMSRPESMPTEEWPNALLMTLDQWAELVDWITEVASVFDLVDICIFGAMYLFARYVGSSQYTDPHKYQLLAGACLRIVSLWTAKPLSQYNLAFSADNAFTCSDIEVAEDRILRKVGFRLAVPTMADHLLLFGQVLGDQNEFQFATMAYTAELALQTSAPLKYGPSQVAASVVVLSRHCSNDSPLWSKQLEEISGCNLTEVQRCIDTICQDSQHIRLNRPDLKMIARKYIGSASMSHLPPCVDLTSDASLNTGS